jgi:hypothetical protein
MLDRPHTPWPRRIYCASKSKHWPFWQALRAAGVPIVCSWIDWPRNHDCHEPTKDEWRRHWDQCMREASDADLVLAYARSDENQNGAFLEIDCALGSGAHVYLVSDHAWSWRHHPRVRSFKKLGGAISAIMAALSVVERELQGAKQTTETQTCARSS